MNNVNEIFPLPDVITNIVLGFCDIFKEEHQRNQDCINKAVSILNKNIQYKMMCYGWRFCSDEGNRYPVASRITDELYFYQRNKQTIKKYLKNCEG